jgi:hypothetical protein
MAMAASHRTRGGTTSTRRLLRASARAPGHVLHRPLATVRHGAAAESAARRWALRPQEDREPLGPLQDAITWKQAGAFGAVWTVYHSARRLGIAQALGTTRAGTRALGPGLARVSAPGARLSAGRLAMAHAACAVLALDALAEAALDEPLAGRAGAQARREARLWAQRPQPTPVSLCVSAVTRSSWEGAPNALAAFGSKRPGTPGPRQLGSGLRGDAAGPPGAIAGLPGNTAAPPTCAAPLEKVKVRVGVTALPFVGDRGMSQGQQGAALAPQGCHDLTALTNPQLEPLRRSGPWHRARCAPEVAEVRADEGRRDGRRRHPGRAQAVRATRPAPLATLQAQGATNQPSRPAPPQAKAQGAGPKRGARAQKRRSAAWVARTVEERALTLARHENAQTAAAHRAGGDGLNTALPPQPAPTASVPARSTERAAVAPAFWPCKPAPRAGRPSFGRRAARTRAPAFVVLRASPIIPSLPACWSPWAITVAAGLPALSTLCRGEVAPTHAPSYHGRPTPRDAIARLRPRADSTLPKVFALSGVRVSTRKKLQAERIRQCRQRLN